MHLDLTDQVALVTGGAHRVGKAIALELARRGVNILIHYGGSAQAATETAREIKSLGVDAHTVQADLGDPAQIAKIFTALREHFGRLNILVNNAATFHKATLLETTLEEWQRALMVNLTAPFLCTQAAAALMRQNQPSGGSIVNICDHGSLRAWPEYAAHGVSKAGLWMLTQTSAASLGPDIRVNAVIPGAVLKPAEGGMTDEQWDKLGYDYTPVRRVGSAEDVARAVAYLVSEDYVNGHAITVDGGEHVWR